MNAGHSNSSQQSIWVWTRKLKIRNTSIRWFINDNIFYSNFTLSVVSVSWFCLSNPSEDLLNTHRSSFNCFFIQSFSTISFSTRQERHYYSWDVRKQNFEHMNGILTPSEVKKGPIWNHSDLENQARAKVFGLSSKWISNEKSTLS